MQPASDHPLFVCGFECVYLLSTGIKVFLNFWGFDLDLWHLEVTWDHKNFHLRKPIMPIHDFLSNFYWHFLSSSNRFWDIWLQSFQGLTLTCRGHLRSKIFSPFESPYMTSCLTSIDTFSLSRIVFEIFDFNYIATTIRRQSDVSGSTGILLNNILILF